MSRYRDLVDIQQDSSAAGSPDPDYSGIPFMRSVPCSIMTKSGDETFRGRQLEAHLSHVIEMRMYPGVKAMMRLIDRGRLPGRVYNVVHVREIDTDDNGRRNMLQLYCEELAPQ
jgi:head-tail adaptor